MPKNFEIMLVQGFFLDLLMLKIDKDPNTDIRSRLF